MPARELRYFADDDFDFAARTAIGHAAQGTGDIGPVLATLNRIENGNAASWYDAWHTAADAARAEAEAARAAGRLETAAACFLAASEAYDQALSFIDGMPDDTMLLPTFRLHRGCWDEFVAASRGRHLPLPVPYQGGTLPGYLFRPDASGAARPTLVVTNGSDGALSGLWATAIRDTLARGWNAFVFDGPGQQSLLFEHGVPFRHDWEAVLTPVVDCLVGRADVDAAGLLAYAISQGGYWLPRALAFERRFVAAVADSGVVDVSRAWFKHLPPPLVALYRSGDAAAFDRHMSMAGADPKTARTFAFRARPYGKRSPFALFSEVARYTLAGLVEHIATPLMITDAEDEAFFPGQSQELYDALGCEKVLVRFTHAQGAGHHCEPMARGLVALRMNDFFAEHLARRRRT